jgi:hypothetical protein
MKFYTRFWVFDQFLSVGVLKLHWRYQRFILSPTSLPSVFWPYLSLVRTPFWAILYLLESLWNYLQDSEKSWAFEHFLSVGWIDDSVGSSGASHFCANTSLYVSRKSIGWTDAIIRWYHQIIRCWYTCFLLLRSSSGAHKMGPSDHPMPYFQHILIWAYLFIPDSYFDDLGLYGNLVE